MAEQNDDFVSSLRALIKSEMIDVNTSINAVVVSYNSGLATVRPTANKTYQDGDSLPFPLIYNVPVRWPNFNGGQCGFKAPIKPGDNVLVIFSQQATDGTDDPRRFDLNDAYCVPAHNSMAGQGNNNDDTIMYFGAAYIKISASGAVTINSPGGTNIIGDVAMTGGVTSNGKNISDSHYHINAGGVGNSGVVG